MSRTSFFRYLGEIRIVFSKRKPTYETLTTYIGGFSVSRQGMRPPPRETVGFAVSGGFPNRPIYEVSVSYDWSQQRTRHSPRRSVYSIDFCGKCLVRCIGKWYETPTERIGRLLRFRNGYKIEVFLGRWPCLSFRGFKTGRYLG